MPARVVAAHPRVDAVRGCVALLRGPLVYCLEQADLPDDVLVEDVTLDATAPVDPAPGDLAPVVLRARGSHRPSGRAPLYGPPGADGPGTPITLTAIPYFLWANRTPGAMRVWIPQVS